MNREQKPATSNKRARRRMSLVLLGLALGIAATASAGGSQWTSTGPDGGPVSAIVISPANAAVLYAGSSAGVFVSRDAGATWAFSNGPAAGVGSIVIDGSGQILYATSDRQVYRSSDGGASWSRVTLTSFPAALGIDPSDPDTVYVGTREGAVYRSSDGGRTYPPQGFASPGTTSLAVVPGSATTAYQASGSGVFKTEDGGLSWTALTSLDAALGPKTNNQYFVAIDAGDPQRVYAVRSSETGSHLCSTTNGGVGWACGGNLFSQAVALSFDHRATLTIYAATLGGVYKSTDRGTTWSKSDVGLSGLASALAVTPDGATLFAGTSAGAFRSTDQGGHWSSSNIGIHAATIPALAAAPIGPPRLYAGTDLAGLFGRGDEGWEALGAAGPGVLSRITAIAVSPIDPATAYAGGEPGVVKTDDGFDHGSLSTLRFPVSTISIDPSAPTNVYAAMAAGFGYGGISKSMDAGATWNSTLAQAVYTLVIDPHHPSTLYAGSDYDTGYYGGEGGAIFKSTDAGETWTRGDKRFLQRVQALAIDPRSPSTLYAVVAEVGVYKSTDGATTWSLSNIANVREASALIVDPVIPGRIFAASRTRVMQSSNGGGTWAALGTGLPSLPVLSLAIEPDGSVLHAGTAGAGVYDYALAATNPCAAGSLCLLGDRFEVTLQATDPDRDLTSGGIAVSQADSFGYFSLPDFTGDPGLPEVLVKMVDASATSFKSFWFFYSGLTSLPYTVTVRDTVTGLVRAYASDGYCGGADTSGFKADPAPGLASIETESSRVLSASGTELSLLSNRFRVTLSATDPDRNQTSDGVAIPQDDRFGYFSLPAFTGDQGLPEVFVKMVDGRSLPGKAFWVFYTGLTSLPYTITVTDTVTGVVQTYDNGSESGAFCGGADTSTFRDPTNQVRLSGTVRSFEGNLARIAILQILDGPDAGRKTQTRDETTGFYEFVGLSLGTIRIKVTAGDYIPVVKAVTLVNKDETADFVMNGP